MKTVRIITNPLKDESGINTEKVKDLLLECGCDVSLAQYDDTAYEKVDLFVVLGGDGTIIKAAYYASKLDIPIVGINLGRKGYLAELEIDELDVLRDFIINSKINNDTNIDKRMMLKIEHISDSGKETMYALNEAVIAKGNVSKICDIKISFENNASSLTYRGDGVIFSTPTGSTAYSLSAGGPIIDPSIECVALTPICCHSVSAKPMIFSSESGLVISSSDINADLYLTVDGNKNVKLQRNDTVKISKASRYTKLIRLKNDSFSDVLLKKMSGSYN